MKIASSRLLVDIDEPGSRYAGTRFDWTSQVASVRLDGSTEILGQELPPGEFRADRGYGLHCEFGIKSPIGYDDCLVGEWFPKIGVGWLRREGPQAYDFFHTYREIEAAEWQWRRESGLDGESLVLSMNSGLRRGWAWSLERTWTVRGNTLECLTRLENTGNKAIETDEYCHNFLAVHGTERHLRFSWGAAAQPGVLVNPEGILALGAGGVDIDGSKSGEFYAAGLGRDLPAGSFWELSGPGQVVVRETLDCPFSHCDLWGKQYVISPELFMPLRLAPGSSQSWRRIRTFGA